MRKILLTLLTTLLCSVTAWTATETLTWSGTSLTGSGGTNTSAGTAAPVNGDTYTAGTISINSSKIQTESKKHETNSYWEDFSCSGCTTEAGAPDPTATARIEFPITINSGYSFTISSVSFNYESQGGSGTAVHVFLVQGATATWIGYTAPASPKSITGLSTKFSAGSAKLVFVLGLTGSLNNNRGFKFNSITISGTSAVDDGGGSSYSITYNCDGGTVCPSNVASATALPNPLPSGLTKSGYAFAGWFTDADKTVAAVAGASIAANTTLYAKWTCAATVPGNISKGSACAGEDLTLTSAGSPASGDTWYWQASSSGTATTNSGATYDVSSAGTYYIRSYNGTCWSAAKSVTVAAGDWTSPSISGASSVTVGNTITLTGSPSGGTWDSSDETKATVNSSGVVSGVAIGNTNITYSKNGCTSDNHAVTVSAACTDPGLTITLN